MPALVNGVLYPMLASVLKAVVTMLGPKTDTEPCDGI